MGLSNVIVDFIISNRSLVVSSSDVQIAAGLTNISGLAVAAFDLLINFSLSIARTWGVIFYAIATLYCVSVPIGR